MRFTLLIALYLSVAFVDSHTVSNKSIKLIKSPNTNSTSGCVCGVFLSGQFKKSNKGSPLGNPVLTHDQSASLPCSAAGKRLCINKCLETIVKYLPNSSVILCSSLERDCYKETAYLFIKNCKSGWVNTNLSAGREYCCKNGAPYKCPIY